jgi:hypothetical protein
MVTHAHSDWISWKNRAGIDPCASIEFARGCLWDCSVAPGPPSTAAAIAPPQQPKTFTISGARAGQPCSPICATLPDDHGACTVDCDPGVGSAWCPPTPNWELRGETP